MAPTIDPVVEDIVARARADDATLALILHGSRGAGFADDESDYDLIWVLTDAEYERRRVAGVALHIEQPADDSPTAPVVDIQYSCPTGLEKVAEHSGWWTPGYADARLLLDKTGEVARLLATIVTLPEERARGGGCLAGRISQRLLPLAESLAPRRRTGRAPARC